MSKLLRKLEAERREQAVRLRLLLAQKDPAWKVEPSGTGQRRWQVYRHTGDSVEHVQNVKGQTIRFTLWGALDRAEALNHN